MYHPGLVSNSVLLLSDVYLYWEEVDEVSNQFLTISSLNITTIIPSQSPSPSVEEICKLKNDI